MILLGIPLLLVTTIYYFNIAKKYEKNTFVFAMLGFFLPTILLIIFISTFNLIISRNSNFYIRKYFFSIGIVAYTLFILLLPQYLSIRWKKSKIDLDDDKILDA